MGINLFAYCYNNAVNEIDPDGKASYKNYITYDSTNNLYKVKTTIKILWTTLTYNYKITSTGIIKFDFTKNNYWSILWRGYSKTLAQAMYKAAKSQNASFLWGRTIGGLNTELQLHYAAYKLKIRTSSSYMADMGGLVSWKPGYDNNAWFFESANAARIAISYNIWYPSSVIYSIRNIARYF